MSVDANTFYKNFSEEADALLANITALREELLGIWQSKYLIGLAHVPVIGTIVSTWAIVSLQSKMFDVKSLTEFHQLTPRLIFNYIAPQSLIGMYYKTGIIRNVLSIAASVVLVALNIFTPIPTGLTLTLCFLLGGLHNYFWFNKITNYIDSLYLKDDTKKDKV